MTCKCGKKVDVRINSDGWYVLEDIDEDYTKTKHKTSCGYWECGFR